MNRVSHAVVVAVICVAGLLLSACGPTPDSSATSTSAASTSTRTPIPTMASPTPSPTPYATAIVVGMTSMKVLDQSGYLIEELSYASPGPDVAAKLTTYFGLTPVETDDAGGLEVWPTHNYNWSGFFLRDELREGAMYLPYWEYLVTVRTTSVNGIEIRTEAGTKVGDPASSVVYDATSPWGSFSYSGMTCGAQALFTETGDINDSVSLWLCSDDATRLVTSFSVPTVMQV